MLRAEDLDPTIHKLPQSCSAEALIYIHSSMPRACILPRPMMKHPFRTQAPTARRMGPILGPGRMFICQKVHHRKRAITGFLSENSMNIANIGELDLDLTKSPRMDDYGWLMRFLPQFTFFM